MNRLRVVGGKAVEGRVKLSGNKNAALPMIAAALLTEEEVVLENMPAIADVAVMAAAAAELGVAVERNGGEMRLRAAAPATAEVSREICAKVRTSVLFVAPLLARLGEASIWPPGGDVIGRRRLDSHFYGLRVLGVDIAAEDAPFRFTVGANGLRGREMFLDEASVTATEQIMMAAVLAEGRTIIRNAASEPHVADLAELLKKMGAKISGVESKTITIDGVERLHGTHHRVVSDHIEAGSFLALAAATGGGVEICDTAPRHYWMARRVFERFGITFELGRNSIRMPAGQRLRVNPDYGNAIPVVSDGPWPQFPSDMMSCAIVMATQAEGTVLFFEKMFESRIYFVDRLIGMGANAIVCDPHRAVISGPARLRGAELASPDIRAGMAMLIAALCAKGESVIGRADVIARGYEDIVAKIRSLGGDVEMID